MTIKTVDAIIRIPDGQTIGSERAFDLVATPGLLRWADHHARTNDGGKGLVYAATGAERWEADGVIDSRTVKVDVFDWAQVRILEAENLRGEGRPAADAAEAYRIVREVEREVAAYLRLHVAVSVAHAFGAHGGNYRRTGAALGISDTAVRNWLSGDAVKGKV